MLKINKKYNHRYGMSPAPFTNDPGKDENNENNSSFSGDIPPGPPVNVDSSDGDSADEIVHGDIEAAGDGPIELMGYQLLPQGFEPMGHELIDDNDDNDSSSSSNEDDNTLGAEGWTFDTTQLDRGPGMGGNCDEIESNPAASHVAWHDALLPEHLQMKTSTDVLERRELWKTCPTSPSVHPPMDPAQAEKIKSVMAGFQLPAEHVPAWSRVIPEDEWKARLMNKLHSPSTAISNSALDPTTTHSFSTDDFSDVK